MLAVVTACDTPYERGKKEGVEEGLKRGLQQASDTSRKEGYDAGFAAGKAAGRTEGDTAGFKRGFVDGKRAGFNEGSDAGRKAGHTAGLAEGLAQGTTLGKNQGLEAGRKEGYAAGLAEGLTQGKALGRNEGLEAGLKQGREEGNKLGRTAGVAEAYDRGVRDGTRDGYDQGFRQGKSEAIVARARSVAVVFGIPVVILALVAGLLLNLFGWRTHAKLADLLAGIGSDLEMRKARYAEQTVQSARRRTVAALSGPDVWFVILTLFTFAGLEYRVDQALTLFLALTGIALAGTLYALRMNPILAVRAMLFWLPTVIIVADVHFGVGARWLQEPSAWAFTCLAIYFLARALFGMGWAGPLMAEDLSRSEMIAIIVATISVTAQLSWLMLLLIRFVAPAVVAGGLLGTALLAILDSVHALSPVSWFPSGVALFMLVLASAVRLGRDKFIPTPYSELPFKPVGAVFPILLIIVKLPAWLLINAFRFLIHFLRQIYETIMDFAAHYLSRLTFIAAALVVPSLCLLQGHTVLANVSDVLGTYFNGGVHTASQLSIAALSVVFSSLLYLICVAALTLEIEQVPLRRAAARIQMKLEQVGASAALSVGVSYCVFMALVIVSVPLVTLLPGSKAAGFFVWSSLGLVGVAVLVVTVNIARADHTTRHQNS